MTLNSDPELATQGLSWIRFIGASILVLGLIGGLAGILRMAISRGWLTEGLTTPLFNGKTALRKKRLKIVESLSLDARRRLVIISCDTQEHLLLLGTQQDIVIATSIPQNQGTSPQTDADSEKELKQTLNLSKNKKTK